MRISCLYQSGVVVELETAILIFDYYKGELPELSTEKDLYVFVSHGHKDHYQECIFQWEKKFSQVYYILSSDIHISKKSNYYFVEPHKEYFVGNLMIQTLLSTDEGVAFLVKVEEKAIYHSGDLHWWHWEGEEDAVNQEMKEAYQREVGTLQNESVDVAFLPIDPRQGETYFWGFDWFMRHVHVKRAIPIHLWGKYSLSKKLLSQGETKGYRDKILIVTKVGEEFIIE